MKNNIKIESKFLQRVVEVDIYTPDNLLSTAKVNLLLVNDGQDLALMNIEEMVNLLVAQRKIDPVIIVGIYAGQERLLEYGIANQPDFKGRGAKANLYTQFLVEEVLPFIEHTIKFNIDGIKAIAGFSLGGLTAFDIAWHNANIFNAVGVFSGSFWWRKKDLNDGYTEDDRILHSLLKESSLRPNLKFWLMCGTDDEKADRNHNFIIDSIDDTIDVVKELVKKGYKRPNDVFYYEMVGGKHDVPSWAKSFNNFLEYTFLK